VALRRRSTVVTPERISGVTAVLVESRPLLVLDGAHFDELVRKARAGDLEQVRHDVTGGIVWVQPYAATLQPLVDAGVAALHEAGAIRVVVLPRETGDRELPKEQVEQAAAAFVGGAGQVRAVVAELLRDAKVDDATRERASELVDQYLTEQGL
jgi:hypothetical protein